MKVLALHGHGDLPAEAVPLSGSGTARIWLIDSTARLPAESLDRKSVV